MNALTTSISPTEVFKRADALISEHGTDTPGDDFGPASRDLLVKTRSFGMILLTKNAEALHVHRCDGLTDYIRFSSNGQPEAAVDRSPRQLNLANRVLAEVEQGIADGRKEDLAPK